MGFTHPMTNEQQAKSRVDELIVEAFGQSLAPLKVIGALGAVMCVILAIAVTYAYFGTPAPVDFTDVLATGGAAAPKGRAYFTRR